MNDEPPPVLEYEPPGTPRPSTPPDGYLGFRSDEPPDGVRLGWVGWLGVAIVTLLIVLGGLWLLGRELSSHGS